MRPKRLIRSIVPSLLGAALPLSVVGAGLYVVGSVSRFATTARRCSTSNPERRAWTPAEGTRSTRWRGTGAAHSRSVALGPAPSGPSRCRTEPRPRCLTPSSAATRRSRPRRIDLAGPHPPSPSSTRRHSTPCWPRESASGPADSWDESQPGRTRWLHPFELHVGALAAGGEPAQGVALSTADGQRPAELGAHPVGQLGALGVDCRWHPLGGVLVGFGAVALGGDGDQGAFGAEVVGVSLAPGCGPLGGVVGLVADVAAGAAVVGVGSRAALEDVVAVAAQEGVLPAGQAAGGVYWAAVAAGMSTRAALRAGQSEASSEPARAIRMVRARRPQGRTNS